MMEFWTNFQHSVQKNLYNVRVPLKTSCEFLVLRTFIQRGKIDFFFLVNLVKFGIFKPSYKSPEEQ